jgi:hypothetical protein
MKQTLQYLLLSFFILQSNIFSQSTVVQQIINSVKQDSIIYFVRELSGGVPTIINGTSQTIISRNKNQAGNALAETYIKQKLQSYGLVTAIQSFSSSGKNVLATQPGTEFPNKKFIICAHYDDMPSGTTAPGADDNASGTSAVLEAARIFSQYTFPYTIVYALWDEEEQGLIGSDYYATQAAAAGDSILGVINLDMISYDSNNDGICNIHNRSVGSSVQLYNKMVEINSQYGINLSIVSYNPGSTYSDHASFWSNGYGAILLIEDDNDFHPNYHTVNDLLQFFNQPYFVKNTKLALAALATLALNLDLNISHTPIASITTSQPINTTAFVTSGLQIGAGSLSPRLFYRTKTFGGTFGNFIEVSGTPTENANYNFIIPALPLGTAVQYYLAAQDANSSVVKTLPAGGGGFNPPGSTPPLTFYQFFVSALNVAMYDEANNINDWTSVSGWNITTTKFVSAPSSFTDSPSGNYASNTTSSLKYKNQVALNSVLGAVLEFDTQWDIEENWDYGQIQISTNNGTNWIPLAGQYTNAGTGTFQPNGEPLYDGIKTTWVHEIIDISNYANNQLALRFLFKSDNSVEKDGWYIDNVKISFYSSIVPVELVSFGAAILNDQINLSWITATELNNLGFEVEKSTNNVNWVKIGFADGYGTSTEVHNYSFADKNPAEGKSFYRLKQIDFDGTTVYTNILEVNYGIVADYSLSQNYPNPFNPNTKISWQSPISGWQTLKIFDVLGKEVSTLVDEYRDAGKYEIYFNAVETLRATSLPSGIFFYRLEAGSFVETKKMILLK